MRGCNDTNIMREKKHHYPTYPPVPAHRNGYSDPSVVFKGSRSVAIVFSQDRIGKPQLPDPFGSPHRSTFLKATGNKLDRVASGIPGFESQILLFMFDLKNTPLLPWFQVLHLQQIYDNHLVDLLSLIRWCIKNTEHWLWYITRIQELLTYILP